MQSRVHKLSSVVPVILAAMSVGCARTVLERPAAEGAPTDGCIAFVRLDDGYWQIWELDLTSARETQRTFSTRDKRYPKWGPDGSLYFRSNNDELYFLANGSSAEEPIFAAHWPAIDPAVRGADGLVAIARLRKDVSDQSAVAFGRPGDRDLSHLTPQTGLRMHLNWSPSGELLVFVLSHGPTSSEIRQLHWPSGDSSVLVPGGARNLNPAIAVDGRLAFASDRSGDFEIWLRDEDGGLARLTEAEGRDWAPSWSPDGSKLVFASARSGEGEIWIADLATGEQTRLVAGPAMDPSWQ